jgi:hypothetical protein
MPARRAAVISVVVLLATACGLTEQPTVNTAELLVETQEVVLSLRDELAAFQDQIDSLRVELTRQDSLLRSLANLQGMPMPPRPGPAFPPE